MPRFPSAPPPSLALRTAIARMRPVALRRPWLQSATVIASSLAATVACVAVLGVRGAPSLAPVVAVLLALFAARVVAATVPPRGEVLPHPAAPWVKTLLAAVGLCASTLVAHAPSSPLGAAWPCILHGMVAATLPTLIAAWVLGPVARNWRVLRELSGAAAALAGVVLLAVCDRRDAAHVVVAHGGALLLAPAFALSTALAALRTLIRR